MELEPTNPVPVSLNGPVVAPVFTSVIVSVIWACAGAASARTAIATAARQASRRMCLSMVMVFLLRMSVSPQPSDDGEHAAPEAGCPRAKRLVVSTHPVTPPACKPWAVIRAEAGSSITTLFPEGRAVGVLPHEGQAQSIESWFLPPWALVDLPSNTDAGPRGRSTASNLVESIGPGKNRSWEPGRSSFPPSGFHGQLPS